MFWKRYATQHVYYKYYGEEKKKKSKEKSGEYKEAIISNKLLRNEKINREKRRMIAATRRNF